MFKRILVFVFFFSVTLLYFHNLTRDVYSGDIGDLVTAAYIGGVPHPPGYPLFTLLGFILSHLPIPLPVISRVGLISVFSSLAALILFYKFCLRVTKSVFLGLLSTSILAFSYLFWLNAEIPEVFALNNFFAVIILYLGILFYEEKKMKYVYLLAFFSGLSLTHHQTVIFLFPSVAILVLSRFSYIFFRHNPVISWSIITRKPHKLKQILSEISRIVRNNIAWKRIIVLIFLLIVGFSVYLYVPIAASHNPPISWDSATNLKNLVWLILRKDYGTLPNVINRVPMSIKIINVEDYFKTLIMSYSYQIIFLFFIGALWLILKNKVIFFSLLIAYFFTGPFFVFYAANTSTTGVAWGIIERFYVFSFVILAFFIPYGFLAIKRFLDTKFSQKIYSYILLSYFLLIPILMIQYNFPRTDLSKTKIGDTLAASILASLPKRAVVFLSGDTSTFNTWYAYYVLKERQDINIINPPGVGRNIFLDAELNKLYKKNPKISLNEIVEKTFLNLRKRRRMFSTYLFNQRPKGTVLVPKGLVYEVVDEKDLKSEKEYLAEVEAIWKNIKVQRRETLSVSDQNFIAPEIPTLYSKALVFIGDFVNYHYNDPSTAEQYYRRALWIDDTFSLAYAGLASAQFRAYKDCKNSVENLNTAIVIAPIFDQFYKNLYILYKECGVNQIKIIQLKKEFKSKFGVNIESQLPVQHK